MKQAQDFKNCYCQAVLCLRQVDAECSSVPSKCLDIMLHVDLSLIFVIWSPLRGHQPS